MKFTAIMLFSLLLIGINANAQGKYLTKEGDASFYSKAPLEDIEAHNNKVSAVLDASNMGVAVSMQMSEFEFEKKLMQEHFNENYIESDQYPTAKFIGNITGDVDFSADGTYSTTAEGEITIHGVTKPLTADVVLNISGDNINVNTKFKIAPKDHDIKIPKLVIKNIAEIVDIDVTMDLAKSQS